MIVTAASIFVVVVVVDVDDVADSILDLFVNPVVSVCVLSIFRGGKDFLFCCLLRSHLSLVSLVSV